MRVALVTDYYLPTLGGVQTAVRAQAGALRDSGHEVTVFCPRAPDAPAEEGIVALPVSSVFRPDGYPFAWSPRAVTAVLAREFRERGIEVVHTHSEMFAALAAIRAARSLGIPVVHTMHGRIDVYTAAVLPAPALTVSILALLHRRLVPHRGIRIRRGEPYTRTRSARLMWRLMVAQARASAHLIVPSAHFARKLAAQGVTTPTTVVSNGLDGADDAAPEPRTLARGEPIRLMWAGRLSPEKRPEVFAEAATILGDASVADLYGEGLARRAVERMRSPVTLHGSVPQAAVREAMRAHHALVSSSDGFDNQPMVILEAVAAGLPVIHCDPDLAETIPPGGGFLTPTPDAAGIVAVAERLRRDPSLVRRASGAMLAAAPGVQQNAEPLVEVYRTALGATAR